ncbi:hypothetical protein B0G38_001865 [Arthrobacter sp. VKM Ac-2550]|nr:hypothetical protein [Arthrobacter sp. VKM Ac-2550]
MQEHRQVLFAFRAGGRPRQPFVEAARRPRPSVGVVKRPAVRCERVRTIPRFGPSPDVSLPLRAPFVCLPVGDIAADGDGIAGVAVLGDQGAVCRGGVPSWRVRGRFPRQCSGRFRRCSGRGRLIIVASFSMGCAWPLGGHRLLEDGQARRGGKRWFEGVQACRTKSEKVGCLVTRGCRGTHGSGRNWTATVTPAVTGLDFLRRPVRYAALPVPLSDQAGAPSAYRSHWA